MRVAIAFLLCVMIPVMVCSAVPLQANPFGVSALVNALTELKSIAQANMPKPFPPALSRTFVNPGQDTVIITFLAESGNADAIEALGHDLQRAPIDVRLAVVTVFKPSANGGGSWIGETVAVNPDMPALPGGATGAAIERLLVTSLDDTQRRLPEVLYGFPVSRSTWWAGISAGQYPKGVKLGPRITAWKVEDIRKSIENRN